MSFNGALLQSAIEWAAFLFGSQVMMPQVQVQVLSWSVGREALSLEIIV
jgi:hypothetical protein